MNYITMSKFSSEFMRRHEWAAFICMILFAILSTIGFIMGVWLLSWKGALIGGLCSIVLWHEIIKAWRTPYKKTRINY